jgi:flagellin
MRINNNVMALNAHRQLAVNQSNAAKSMERLSSGMRINRAGDDAAGLAISEKMRGQIRGLKQAQRNAQDGISLIQTAEGALNEIHAILQRMRELATQSATDTNTIEDRKEIQEEINQLAEEITRIADTTEFNTQNLLGGKFAVKFHIGANEGQNVDLAINAMDANALKVAGSGEGLAQFTITVNGDVTVAGTEAIGVGEHEFDVVKLDNITIVTMVDSNNDPVVTVANYGLANDKGEIVAVSQDGKSFALLAKATKEADLKTAEPLTETEMITFADPVIDGRVTLTAEQEQSSDNIILSNIEGTASVEVAGLQAGEYKIAEFKEIHTPGATWANEDSKPKFALLNSDGDVVALGANDGKKFYAIEDLDLSKPGLVFTDLTGEDGVDPILSVETGFKAGDTFEVKADGGINVSDQKSADKAITTINEAIETVSAERSKLGAMQNRLEHTIANLGTSAENLQAAESRIRDLDMAEEIMAFTKNNILQQAATAMLAQANMAPQSVLQLLG